MASQDAELKNPSIDEILAVAFQRRNILLHGPGGVGKSWLLKRLAKGLSDLGLRVYITATTGVAALGVSDKDMRIVATTLHRFAGIGTASLGTKALINKVRSDFRARKRWEKAQVLLIDEVSMLGSGLFTKLDAIAKDIRKNDKPMGGIQLILSADFLQLPPVKDDWIFVAKAWNELNIRPFILEVPHRYDDVEFFQLLLRVRKGNLSDDDSKTLMRRVRANQRMQDILTGLATENPAEIIRPTMFFSRKVDVEAFNDQELSKLSGEEIVFTARDTFIAVKGNPKYEDYQKLLDDDMPREVTFKVGAQVMLKVNLNTEEGYVNGSRGVISEIIPGEAMIVKFLNGTKLRVDVQTRELEDKNATLTRTQIPFVLAYAMTIHKGQGSTLDYCVVDLGPSVFAEGQAYVALSRCRNIKGLFISEFLPRSIIANPIAVKFSNKLEEQAKLEG
jgi:ATP-dependent DNA helicase PIF1